MLENSQEQDRKIANSTSQLLVDGSPLLVLQPVLATALGNSDEAIILQQVQYWLTHSQNVHEGRKWVYNSLDKWKEQFPWLSKRTIARKLKSLEKRKILVTARFNKYGFDRTLWYSIDYNQLYDLRNEMAKHEKTNLKNATGQNDSLHKDKVSSYTETGWHNAQRQAGNVDEDTMAPSHEDKLSTPIPIDYTETTHENTQKTNTRARARGDEHSSSSLSVGQIKKEFEELWSNYPRKMGKRTAFNHYKTWRKRNPKQHTFEFMKNKIAEYVEYLSVKHVDSQYILYGSTWFSGRFEDDWSIDDSNSTTANDSDNNIVDSILDDPEWAAQDKKNNKAFDEAAKKIDLDHLDKYGFI